MALADRLRTVLKIRIWRGYCYGYGIVSIQAACNRNVCIENKLRENYAHSHWVSFIIITVSKVNGDLVFL